ncbi:MAG: hypothetical protein LC754_13085 [Acidobacteria bacterium]|nr:hypothetical protein [Acidobacteriota bacterium]
MHTHTATLALVLLFQLSAPAQALNRMARAMPQPEASDKTSGRLKQAKQRIKKVLYYDSALWVLGLNGMLLNVDLKTRRATQISPDKVVFDVYVSPDRKLYLLTGAREGARDMHVWQRAEDAWKELAPFSLGAKSSVIGVREFRGRLLVLTERAIYLQREGDGWRAVALKSALRAGYQSPFAVTDDGLIYLGFNLGEWGGGLAQVNVETGEVRKIEKVERKDKDDICAGPLNSECDPVTGVIRDPENPTCVIASIGLRHFLETGRLVRVCHESVAVVFRKHYNPDETGQGTAVRSTERVKSERYSTEAIFDLVPGARDYWAVTGRGIYYFKSGEKETFYAMPKLRELSGIALSDDIPGLVIVSTDINWARSLSGYTPLLAIKD